MGTPQTLVDIGAPDHSPELYAFGKSVSKGQWNGKYDLEKCKQDFDRDGFLVVNGMFSGLEVESALAAISSIVRGENERFEEAVRGQAGKTPNFNDGDHWALVQWEKGTDMGLPAEEREDKARKVMGFCEFDDRLTKISTHPGLQALLKAALGATEDVQLELFQDMALLKPPGGREKPWHQDNAYFNLPVNAKVIGMWMALDEATPENGCMRVLRGRQNDGPIVHFQRRDFQICDSTIQEMTAREDVEVVAIPLKPGDFVIFNSMLPHGTPTNRTNASRRALQLHYTTPRVERIRENDRLAIWGSEGKDVHC